MKKKLFKDILYPIIALLLFIAIYAIISAVDNRPLVLPQVDKIFNSFFSLLGTNEAWVAVGGTLLNVVLAFVISFIVAIFLAIISTIYPTLHKIIAPFNAILKAAPTVVIILLSVIWISNYREIPILIGFIIAYPVLYAFFRNTFVNVDKDLLDMTKTYKVSKWNQLRYVYVPSVLPSLLDSAGNVISLTVKVVIASEILAGLGNCIGSEIKLAINWLPMEVALAYTLLAIVLSFILELIFLGLKKLAEAHYGYKN